MENTASSAVWSTEERYGATMSEHPVRDWSTELVFFPNTIRGLPASQSGAFLQSPAWARVWVSLRVLGVYVNILQCVLRCSYACVLLCVVNGRGTQLSTESQHTAPSLYSSGSPSKTAWVLLTNRLTILQCCVIDFIWL